MAYATAEDVIEFTGHEAEDFNLSNTSAFYDLVGKWIGQAESIINTDRGRTFDLEDDIQYAPLLQNITTRLVANMMAKAIQLRTSPVERIDDFTVRVIDTKVIDAGIRADLNLLPTGGLGIIGMCVVNEATRLAEEEAE